MIKIHIDIFNLTGDLKRHLKTTCSLTAYLTLDPTGYLRVSLNGNSQNPYYVNRVDRVNKKKTIIIQDYLMKYPQY